MDRLPYIEKAYRDFLAKRGPIHETMLEERRRYDEGEGRLWLPRSEWPEEMPEQVSVPGTIAYNLYKQLMNIRPEKAKQAAQSHKDPRMEKALLNWAKLGDSVQMRQYHEHVYYSSYSDTRHTYYVTDSLWREMEKVEWPGETPAEALKYLPLPAFAIVSQDETVYTVCYDLLTRKEKSGQMELRIGVLTRKGEIAPLLPLHLTGTLDEAVDSAIIQAEREARSKNLEGVRSGLASDLKAQMHGLVNTLLYLGGENDTSRRESPDYPDGPSKSQKRGTEGTRFEEEVQQEPVEADVGVRFQRAFQRHEREQEKTESEESGGSEKRPHIRRPHPHLYWTGPGREIPKVKYLGPIGVNIEAEEKELPPTRQDIE
jgi:hypothetical protein